MTMTASSIASSSAVEHPRLAPLRGTGGLWVRLFAMLFRRQLGKVMTPVWVIYARMPHLLWPQVLMLRLAQRGLSLDPTLLDLVQIRVSMVNGCAFCTDLHRAVAMRSAREEKKLAALDDLAHGDALTAKERVALLFVDEVTRNGVAGDSTARY